MKTATQIHYETVQLELAKHRLAICDIIEQAEIIAGHYTAHAMIALELKRLVHEVRFVRDSEAARYGIEYLTEQIKRNHASDLGIPLEWK